MPGCVLHRRLPYCNANIEEAGIGGFTPLAGDELADRKLSTPHPWKSPLLVPSLPSS